MNSKPDTSEDRTRTVIRYTGRNYHVKFTSSATGIFITTERKTLDEAMTAMILATSPYISELIVRSFDVTDSKTRTALEKWTGLSDE